MTQDRSDREFNDVENVNYKLETFIRKLKANQIDPFIISNFELIQELLTTGSGQMTSIDVFKAVNLDHLYESALAAIRARSFSRKVIIWAEILRNILVLCPILLTWHALSSASGAYLAAVKITPSLLERPFLLQWEEGFSRSIPEFFGRPLTFSYVALIDAGIIGFIIVLTLVVMSASNMQSTSFSNKANKIVSEAQNLLLTIEKYLAQFRVRNMEETVQKTNLIITSVNTLVDDFRAKGHILEETINLEKDRLDKIAYERMKSTEQFSQFTEKMTNITQSIEASNQKTESIIQALSANIGGLSREINGISASQGHLVQSIDRLEKHFTALEGCISQLSADQARLLGDVKGFVGETSAHLANLSDLTDKMASSTRVLVSSQNDVNTLLTNQISSTDGWVKKVEQGLSQLAGVSDALNNLRASIAELQQISVQVKDLAGADRQLAQEFQTLGRELLPIKQSVVSMQHTNSQVAPVLQDAVSRINGLAQLLQAEVQGLNTFAAELRNNSTVTTENRKTAAVLAEETNKLADGIKLLNAQINGNGNGNGRGEKKVFGLFRLG